MTDSVYRISGLCSSCQDNYYVSGATDCPQCSTTCATCNSTACLTCKTGYYLSSGSCLACSASCLTCSGASATCTKCVLPASLSSSNTCITCN